VRCSPKGVAERIEVTAWDQAIDEVTRAVQ
jgi:hypothetical protein